MPDTILQVKNLCRYYIRGEHTVKAVDDISFDISLNKITAVVGSSGSGKSTILNLLAGLDSPTSGEVAFDGKTLQAMSRRELARYRALEIGMVFQSFNLIPHYTALTNVAMALYFNDTPRSERENRAAKMLESLGLGDRMDHKPSDLSGGEQQRVAIARALVKHPSILFADEPTGNLDRENSKQIGSQLTKLNQAGLTIVLVTHDMELAKQSADTIIKMDYGKIIQTTSRGEKA